MIVLITRTLRPGGKFASNSRMNAGVSSPCNWTAVNPACCTISATRAADSLRKTPTSSMLPGSCAMIPCASSNETRRLLGANTNPSASAPASIEAAASSMQVVAQILIQVRMSLLGNLCPQSVNCATPLGRRSRQLRIEARFLENLPEFLAGIISPHQRFTNQEGLVAKIVEFPDL